MSAPEEGNATIVVIEMRPGWVYVKIGEPKPEPERIELLLRQTIEQWFNAHPQFVIDRTQPVTEQGTLQGFYVWYHVKCEQPPTLFTVEVHEQVAERVSNEHLEAVAEEVGAVVKEAMQTHRSYPARHETFIAITPRRIAVILDRLANRAALVPVELIYPRIDDSMRTSLQTWLAAPKTRLCLIHLAGSWFAGGET